MNHLVKLTEIKSGDTTVQNAEVDNDQIVESQDQVQLYDRQIEVALDFKSPEEKKNVAREDYVIEIDDCSF